MLEELDGLGELALVPVDCPESKEGLWAASDAGLLKDLDGLGDLALVPVDAFETKEGTCATSGAGLPKEPRGSPTGAITQSSLGHHSVISLPMAPYGPLWLPMVPG